MLLLGHLQLEQGRDDVWGATPLAVHLEGCSGVLPHFVAVLHTISALPPGNKVRTHVHHHAQEAQDSSMLFSTKNHHLWFPVLSALV